MKPKLLILASLFPLLVQSQAPWETSAPFSFLWKVVGERGFSAGQALYLSMAFSQSGQPIVAYKDYGNQAKATVMQFDGTHWNNMGVPGFSGGEVWFTSLAVSPSGQPYIAYEDAMNSYKATVMTLNGGSWASVGPPGFTAGIANYTSLALPPSGSTQPYIAFMDGSHSNKATVMKFDGSSWVYVGSPGFSAGEADFLSLAFSPSGDAYVAFQDYGHSMKASVMKFNGTSWVDVGQPGFSNGPADYIDLKFSITGFPHVAYWDETVNATVMKFNGTSWETVGQQGFSTGEVAYTSMAINQFRQVYVAFIDVADNHIPKVMKYNSQNWVPVDLTGVSTGWADFTCLAFNSAGRLYVAFQDGDYSNRSTVKVFDSLYVGVGNKNNYTVRVYPNPASESICIDLPSEYGSPESMEIFGVPGMKFFSSRIFNNSVSLDIRSYPPGIYFLRIKTTSAEFTGRFCKTQE